MRFAVVAGIFAALLIGAIACATPPIDESLDTDNVALPTRTPVPEGGTGTDSATPAPVDASADAIVDAGVDAASLVPSGSYSGNYTNNRPNNGCNFTNAGTLTATFTTTGTDLATTATTTGLQIQDQDCNEVARVNGNAPSSAVTNTAGTFTGTWKLNVQSFGGTLDMPFTAKLSGKTITGSWTCASCTGGFTITQP